MKDGTVTYLEQTSMEPHTTMLYMVGANDSFVLSGMTRVS